MFRRNKKALSDEEIVKVIVEEKDHDRFSELYDRYADKVYRKCISFVKDEAVAQDLTHDIFLKAFLNLAKFNFRSSFSTWLYSMSYNYCVDHVRKTSKVRFEKDDVLVQVPDDQDEKNERELLSIQVERLQYVLDQILPDDKAILLMKYQDDLSIKELAAALELSSSAVKMRVKRARARAVETYQKTFSDA